MEHEHMENETRENRCMENANRVIRCGRDCRILFTDIDGTLLNDSHHVPEATRRKLLELEEKGIPVILVSARMPQAIRRIGRELGFDGMIVCYSGGLILDRQGHQIYSRQISLGQAEEIKQLLEREYPDICCNTYGMDQWIVDDDENPWVVEEERITEGKSTVGTVGNAFAENGGIHKFLLMGEPKRIDAVEGMLRGRYPNLTVLKSKADYLEVMEGAVQKAEAVRFLCGYLGIPTEQAAAFGDGENDLDMLRSVRYGYAMANAPEAVRAGAPFVTWSNEEEGLLEAIRDL